MYGSLHGIEAGRASMPVQHKILMQSLLNFQFLKTFPVPQFSLLNPQIFGTYKLWHAHSISDTYKVLTSGFQLPQAAWARSIEWPMYLLWLRLYGVIYSRNYLTNVIAIQWKCGFSYMCVHIYFGKCRRSQNINCHQNIDKSQKS